MANPNGHLVHGKYHTRLHGVWQMMKQRCFNHNQRTFNGTVQEGLRCARNGLISWVSMSGLWRMGILMG